jgi:hypothetical protein
MACFSPGKNKRIHPKKKRKMVMVMVVMVMVLIVPSVANYVLMLRCILTPSVTGTFYCKPALGVLHEEQGDTKKAEAAEGLYARQTPHSMHN